MVQKFGGTWTERKLESVRKYLSAYTKIFASNTKASFYRTVYLDAFAGSGWRDMDELISVEGPQIFEDETDVSEYRKGSALIALEVNPPFNKYIYIEKDETYAAELNQRIKK